MMEYMTDLFMRKNVGYVEGIYSVVICGLYLAKNSVCQMSFGNLSLLLESNSRVDAAVSCD